MLMLSAVREFNSSTTSLTVVRSKCFPGFRIRQEPVNSLDTPDSLRILFNLAFYAALEERSTHWSEVWASLVQLGWKRRNSVTYCMFVAYSLDFSVSL